MNNIVIVGSPMFSIQFNETEFRVLDDCCRMHYSSDVRRLRDQCRSDRPGSLNGIVYQMEQHFEACRSSESARRNGDAPQPVLMYLSFRDLDIIMKAFEIAPHLTAKWDVKENLAFLEMSKLIQKALTESNQQNWMHTVTL